METTEIARIIGCTKENMMSCPVKKESMVIDSIESAEGERTQSRKINGIQINGTTQIQAIKFSPLFY